MNVTSGFHKDGKEILTKLSFDPRDFYCNPAVFSKS